MWAVWKAPATDRGLSLALAGGSCARAASWSILPAATTWPAALRLAAVRPCLASVSSTSSGSPPSTAVMPVGVAADAVAIARPRSRTSTRAASAVITPAPAAAVISPTLCPATAPTTLKASEGCGNNASAASRPDATSSGWAIAVSLMVSASEVVPWATRSSPHTAENQSSRSSTPGTSSQGVRKPGDWAP